MKKWRASKYPKPKPTNILNNPQQPQPVQQPQPAQQPQVIKIVNKTKGNSAISKTTSN